MSFRIGVMLDDGTPPPSWFIDAVNRLEAVPMVQIAALIVVEGQPSSEGTSASPIRRIADGWLRRSWRHVQSMEAVQEPSVLATVPIVRVHAKSPASSHEIRLTLADVEAVGDQHLDAILRLGVGALRGEILGVAKDGVWAFDHHEHSEPWGQLAGIREVARGEWTSTTHLIRIAESPGEATILASGTTHVDRHSYGSTLDRVLSASSRWPAERCRRLLAGVESPSAPTVTPDAEADPERARLKMRSDGSVLVAAVREQVAGIRRRVRRLFYEEQWNIGVSTAPVEAWLTDESLADQVRWMPEPSPAVFLADPFPVQSNGDIELLAEEFQRPIGRGVIRRIGFDPESGFASKETALSEPHHLSYPFVIEDGGRRYCIPETADAREVSLYEEDADGSWLKTVTLIPDRDLVDATVFWHSDRWWLWAADREIEQWAALTVWHAPALTGPWVEHVLKPVKLDVRSSRPGGTPFMHGGDLYRPAQDCSRTYGARLVINRVVELSPTTYQEEVVRVVEPGGAYPHGMHHLAEAGSFSLVDGKRWMRHRLLDVARLVWVRVTRRRS